MVHSACCAKINSHISNVTACAARTDVMCACAAGSGNRGAARSGSDRVLREEEIVWWWMS
eukprot:1471706-Amphidinium_carterae.1